MRRQADQRPGLQLTIFCPTGNGPSCFKDAAFACPGVLTLVNQCRL